MARYRVLLDENTCIGCKACTVACKNFAAKDDTARVVNEIIDQSELKENQDAEQACPVKCITITKIAEEKEE